jgi:hypothetical protein
MARPVRALTSVLWICRADWKYISAFFKSFPSSLNPLYIEIRLASLLVFAFEISSSVSPKPFRYCSTVPLPTIYFKWVKPVNITKPIVVRGYV